ncbi:MAG: glycosyltransferase family 1 protein [Pseudomonadota bacterium]
MTANATHAGKEAGTAPLRVALFSGNYNYVMDGPVRALNKLVAHLETRGHDVLVFAPTVKKAAFQHSGELVSVPSLALPGSRSEYRLGLGVHGQVRRRLERFAPTLIHISAPDYIGFTALKFAIAQKIPAVASFHTRFDTYPRYYGARWLEPRLTRYMRWFYNQCEHVYPPSQSMADELAAENIGRELRLWTRGVDREVFTPSRRDPDWRRSLGFEPDDVVVVFVGRLVLEKGIDLFADAVVKAQASHPTIKALIVGDGPERDRFAARLPGAVFVGYQQDGALGRAYASGDIFFNPSITETFGNVTLEAMACGLPSIVAAASGSKSLITDGDTGLLRSPDISANGGADGFAEALAALAGDAKTRKAMGARAARTAENYSWTTILDALIRDYRDAIANYTPR